MQNDFKEIPENIQLLVKEKKYIEARKACQLANIDYTFLTQIVNDCQDQALKLFNKKEYEQSIKYYILTIGFVDPSIVLWHFIVPHLSIHLTNYLIELHKSGYANSSHTGLLFLLFRNSDARNKLQEFISLLKDATTKYKIEQRRNSEKKLPPPEPEPLIKCFDAGAAIDALIENEMEKEALEIAWTLDSTQHIVSLLITYKKDYVEAANQIKKNQYEGIGRRLLMQYGPILMEEDENTRGIITKVARDIWCSQNPGQDKDFLQLFQNQPDCCFQFLKSIINNKPTPLLATTLIAMVIPRKSESKSDFFGLPRIASEQLARDYIQNPRLQYDYDHLLRVCAEAKFISGMILLLERQGRLHDITSLLISHNESKMLREWCNKSPQIPDEDWVEIFRYFSRAEGWKTLPNNAEGLNFMKLVIKNASKTMPLAALVKSLSSNPIPLDLVRNELVTEYKTIQDQLEKQKKLNEQLTLELKKIDDEIADLEENEKSFTPSGCAKCRQKLEKHFIAFMCGHIYHTHCAGISEDGHYYCPQCGDCTSPELDTDEFADNQTRIDLSKSDLLPQIIDMIYQGALDQ